MTSPLTVLAAVLAAGMLLGAITLFALEGREVAVLRTLDREGAAHQTRVWVADENGHTWIEAANAERPFLLDIRGNPEVELQRRGDVARCHAVPVANPEGHEHIRRLLATRYGWADRWVGLLTDTSGSLAIRLDCR